MRARSFRPNPTRVKRLPWYRRDGGLRLTQDREVIAEAYPDLVFHIDEETQRVSLVGTVTLRSVCGVPRPIAIRIDFPRAYPRQEPTAYDATGRFPHIADRHFYPDGRCCLWIDCETPWDAAVADGLRTFLDQVSLFFDRQLVVDALPSGDVVQWPGPERGHGLFGYLELVTELLEGDSTAAQALTPVFARLRNIGRNELCPCGSGRKFKWCHLVAVVTVRRKVGDEKLMRMFRRILEIGKMCNQAAPEGS